MNSAQHNGNGNGNGPNAAQHKRRGESQHLKLAGGIAGAAHRTARIAGRAHRPQDGHCRDCSSWTGAAARRRRAYPDVSCLDEDLDPWDE